MIGRSVRKAPHRLWKRCSLWCKVLIQCKHAVLAQFKKRWHRSVFTRRTCAARVFSALLLLKWIRVQTWCECKPHPFDGDPLLTRITLGLPGVDQHCPEWCLRIKAPAGMSRTLLVASLPLFPFPSVSNLFSCFPTIKISCWLSPLSRFSTNCSQVIVLLNLCKNFKQRYYHLPSPLVDYCQCTEVLL